jgi:Tol biopolymer transport system component
MADPAGLLLQPAIAAAPERKLKLGVPWIAAVAVVSVIIAGVAVWRFKPAEGRQLIRFEYNLPEGQQFSGSSLALSPDGRQIVYSTPKGLYLRTGDELTAKPIVGTEGDTQQPFFSPDGKWIGYFSVADRKLKKVAVNGGTPVPLCDIGQNFWGVWWNEDDTILFGLQSVGMMRISANGGDPECIFKQKAGTFIFPQTLPDGKWVMCTSLPTSLAKIIALPLKSEEDKELFRGVNARYLQTGHILYQTYDNSNLYAVQFDLAGLAVKGKPVPMLEGVGQYAISDSGTLAYIPTTREGGATVGRTLVWVNREGKEEPCSAAPNEYGPFRISPDASGTRVALTVGASPKQSLYIWDVVGESMRRLALDEGTDNGSPLWTLDAKRIVYASSRENVMSNAIYWVPVNGTGKAEKLTSSLPGQYLFPHSWANNGRTLVLSELALTPLQTGVAALSVEGDHAKKTLFKEKNLFSNEPRISGDGRWIAYASRESGRCEVYVRSFPEVDRGKLQVSTNGGHSPLWSPDDRELFYRSGDDVVSVRVETEPTFKPGRQTVLFSGAYVDVGGTDMTYWDISPDGKRFLMMKKPAAEAPRKINIVVNWLEELKRRVPVK